jgi:cation transport ATPase
LAGGGDDRASDALRHADAPEPALRLIEFALSTATVFGPGGDIFRKAWMLAKQREANMDTLIAIGAGAAWGYSLPGVLRPQHHVYFESAAEILSFVLAGRYMEERAKDRASEAIRKLIELQPATALQIRDGVEEEIAVDDLVVGDLVRVRPGDKVPTDGVLVEGGSAIDESLLTGESLPVAKGLGDAVAGGCLNGTGAFVMRVSSVGGDTVLSGIIRMVDHAQGTKLPVQRMADAISARFVPAVGAIAAATLGGWLLAGHPASRALARPGAREAIALLHPLGMKTVMATGDVEAAARHIAREVGIDKVIARATPADKLELIRRLQKDGAKVGMIGDGINDAPALAAVEAADITLVGGDIARVAAGIELSRRTMRVIRQNLFWALGYNVVAIPIAAAGRLNPMIAAAAMGMSSVSVLTNSLRLQR